MPRLLRIGNGGNQWASPGMMPSLPGMGDGRTSLDLAFHSPVTSSPFLGVTPNSHFAPGRRFGLELLQSMLQKEHELNLTGSYNTPLLGTLTYAVPR